MIATKKVAKNELLGRWNGKSIYGIDKTNHHMEHMNCHVNLVMAMMKSAIDEGDYRFFDSDMGKAYCDFINQRTSIPLQLMRDKALENYKQMNKSIFDI